MRVTGTSRLKCLFLALKPFLYFWILKLGLLVKDEFVNVHSSISIAVVSIDNLFRLWLTDCNIKFGLQPDKFFWSEISVAVVHILEKFLQNLSHRGDICALETLVHQHGLHKKIFLPTAFSIWESLGTWGLSFQQTFPSTSLLLHSASSCQWRAGAWYSSWGGWWTTSPCPPSTGRTPPSAGSPRPSCPASAQLARLPSSHFHFPSWGRSVINQYFTALWPSWVLTELFVCQCSSWQWCSGYDTFPTTLDNDVLSNFLLDFLRPCQGVKLQRYISFLDTVDSSNAHQLRFTIHGHGVV